MSQSITLHYHRPPERTDVFVQELLYANDDVLVTFLAATPLKKPVMIDGQLALEPDAPAIWFTFPGMMHDIGRFHTVQGEFTGLYANVMRPVEIVSEYEWRATDLFVDVWVGIARPARIIDVDELGIALANRWIDAATGASALAEAERLVAQHEAGAWPPAIVNEWTLERVSGSR